MDEDSCSNQFEKIISLVGYGFFQKRFNYIFNFAFLIIIGGAYYNVILALAIPDHWCNVPQPDGLNFSNEEWKNRMIPRKNNFGVEEFQRCEMYNSTGLPAQGLHGSNRHIVDCQDGWVYDRIWYKETIASKENWVCDKEVYVANAILASTVGECVGATFFGYIGDRFGRRPVYITAVVVLLTGRTLSLLTSHIFWVFAGAVFLGSVASLAIFQATLIVALEISDTDNRGSVAFSQTVGWSLSFCYMAGTFWLFGGEWFGFMLATSLPVAVVVLCFRYMIESPRWLLRMGKTEECIKVLKNISKANGKEFSVEVIDIVNSLSESSTKANKRDETIMSSKMLIKNTIFLMVGWCTTMFTYGVLFLNVSNIGGNPFVNYILQALAEIPGYVLGTALAEIIGRRLCRLLANILMTLSCFFITVVILFPEWEYALYVLCAVAKFSVCFSLYVLCLQTLEIYPTPLRQRGLALSVVSFHIFSTTAPYVIYLGRQYNEMLPYAVCTVLGLLGALTSLTSPETLYKRLPETIADAENLAKEQKFWQIPKKPEKSINHA